MVTGRNGRSSCSRRIHLDTRRRIPTSPMCRDLFVRSAHRDIEQAKGLRVRFDFMLIQAKEEGGFCKVRGGVAPVQIPQERLAGGARGIDQLLERSAYAERRFYRSVVPFVHGSGNGALRRRPRRNAFRSIRRRGRLGGAWSRAEQDHRQQSAACGNRRFGGAARSHGLGQL